MSEVSRPWQGAVLAVLWYGLAISLLLGIFFSMASFFMAGSLGESMASTVGSAGPSGFITGVVGALGIGLAILLIPFAYWAYASGRGFWKGKYWPLVMTLLMSGFCSLGAFMPEFYAPLLVFLLPFGLSASLLRHPFYRTGAKSS